MCAYKGKQFLKVETHLKITLDDNEIIPDYNQKAKQHHKQDMGVEEGNYFILSLKE